MAYAIHTKSPTLSTALRPARNGPRIGLFHWLHQAITKTRNEVVLWNLPPHLQQDIGLTKGDIAYLEARKTALSPGGIDPRHAL